MDIHGPGIPGPCMSLECGDVSIIASLSDVFLGISHRASKFGVFATVPEAHSCGRATSYVKAPDHNPAKSRKMR